MPIPFPLRHLYHEQEIVKAGLVPLEFVLLNSAYRPEMHGVEPPNRVYAHIAGIDLIRTGERDFFVLEDNVRTPSGVSYLLENREIMMRLFPEAFDAAKCALISFDSTMRSNVSVGPPIDLLIYRRNSLKKDFATRLEDDDPYLQAIRDGWGGAIHKAFHAISHDPGWTF